MKAIRSSFLRAAAALVALAVSATPRTVRAQADINPPLPNVLLLVDTSGSMEYQANGDAVTCNPASTSAVNHKSRWIDVVEVLTGTIDNYSCQSIDRTDSSAGGFKTGEYSLGGLPPYDYRYPIPYHRPLSNGCATAPGSFGTQNPFIYPAAGITHHGYNSMTACSSWSQRGNDGVLDSFRGEVRFGLMTFDTAVNEGTGFDGAMAGASMNASTGFAGLWSYVPDAVATGAPSGCSPTSQEVGARNAAAPPWEGRMVNFGNPYDGVRAYETKNDHIQEILISTRPYGATPIAGMLQDAYDFFDKDKTKDPDRYPASLLDSDPASDFGPWEDPYLRCDPPRNQIIILLTDGQPNLDLKPYCDDNTEIPKGKCPFDLPEKIAENLNKPTTRRAAIQTYVVGFALDKVDDDNNPSTPPLDCNTLTEQQAALDGTSLCSKPANAGNAALQACCTLTRIALKGGTTDVKTAFFSSNRDVLRSHLNTILTSKLETTSRTQPVAVTSLGTAASTNSTQPSGGARFFSGFNTVNTLPWYGSLQRQRIVCDDESAKGIPTPKPIDPAFGDDFQHNLAKGGPDARRVYTVVGGATVSDTIDSSATIRPFIGSTDPDGVGTYGGRPLAGTSQTFIDNLPTDAISIPASSCIDKNGNALSATACKNQFFKWWLGYDNGQAPLATSRCLGAAACRLLGDIGHSTPVVIDRPAAAIRDESYSRFAYQQQKRPQVLYVSSNDGLLHAFKTASNDDAEKSDLTKRVLTDGASNELWAFVPPATLPNVYHLYPHTHQVLLDGTPTVQDVVAVTPAQADQPPTVFERTSSSAQGGSSSWRTVLVQGFGAGHSGYFALDVTNPVPNASDPDDTSKGGPRMLWQLTRDDDDKNLFGRGGGTPAIATLFFDPTGGTNPREIPVAILPGGPGGTLVAGGAGALGAGCPETGTRSYSDVTIDTGFTPRPRVRCYDFAASSEYGARSLTIVRLDTGEIVRTFRQKKTEVSTDLQDRVTEVDLDVPVTGQPVAFPGLVGQVADRVFVGDEDGRLWRVNLASANPANWTMKLFFDLYPSSFSGNTGMTYAEGQPIMVPPLLSVDDDNNLILNIASGDQESLGAAPGQSTFVYSLKEKINSTQTGVETVVNWYRRFPRPGSGEDGGTRVVGPMALFNRGLYFGTFTPVVNGDVCRVGKSEIWAMDYLTPYGSDKSLGGAVITSLDPPPPTPPAGKPQLIDTVDNAVAFGLIVTQQPSCYDSAQDLVGDGLLGLGGQRRLGAISTGKFQLVYQTGNNKTGTDVPTANVGVKVKNLLPPSTMSSIESWASIVE